MSRIWVDFNRFVFYGTAGLDSPRSREDLKQLPKADGSLRGWGMKRLLMLAVLLTTAAQAATGVMTSNVNLRRTARATGAVLTVIPKGTGLTVACSGSWCRTTYKGQSGYVARSLVWMLTGTTSLSTPPQPAQRADVVYANCTAAKAAGAAPIMRGQPGYRPKLDRDNEGVACE